MSRGCKVLEAKVSRKENFQEFSGILNKYESQLSCTKTSYGGKGIQSDIKFLICLFTYPFNKYLFGAYYMVGTLWVLDIQCYHGTYILVGEDIQ